MHGVETTDFAQVYESWTPEQLHAPSPYRFMTTATFPDRETFEKSFYDPAELAQLNEDIKVGENFLFLISEILTSTP